MQPPATERFNLLVDQLNETKTFGHATDMVKINANRVFLSETFDSFITKRILRSNSHGVMVFAFGRYISVLKLNRDLTQGQMWFFDFKTEIPDHLCEQTLNDLFGATTTIHWFEVRDFLRSNFSPSSDIFELHAFGEP